MPKTTGRQLLVIGDERHLVDPDKLLLSETIAAEKATRLTWPQIWIGLSSGQSQAIQAVIWLMRKRSNPKLKLSDVEFNYGDYALRDPDFLLEYWIPDTDEDADNPPDAVVSIDAPEDDAPELEDDGYDDGGPKAERPQDTTPQE